MSCSNPGSARAHACCFRRLAESVLNKGRCARALTPTREARALRGVRIAFHAVIFLLGVGLLTAGCANDGDSNRPHHRRHGGHNSERMETVPDTPSPTPSPSRLW